MLERDAAFLARVVVWITVFRALSNVVTRFFAALTDVALRELCLLLL